MTSISRHIANLLWAAQQGYVPDDDDLDGLPPAAVEITRAAAARVAGLALAGDRTGANAERTKSLRELPGQLAEASVDPHARLTPPRDDDFTPHEIAEAARTSTPLPTARQREIDALIANVPPTY